MSDELKNICSCLVTVGPIPPQTTDVTVVMRGVCSEMNDDNQHLKMEDFDATTFHVV